MFLKAVPVRRPRPAARLLGLMGWAALAVLAASACTRFGYAPKDPLSDASGEHRPLDGDLKDKGIDGPAPDAAHLDAPHLDGARRDVTKAEGSPLPGDASSEGRPPDTSKPADSQAHDLAIDPDSQAPDLAATPDSTPPVLSHGAFFVTTKAFDETVNHDQECKKQFGSSFRITDWNDITAYYAKTKSLVAFFRDLDLPPPGDPNHKIYSVSRNGSEIYTGVRHYFIDRHDHNKPSHFLAHANINNYELSLGSWQGLRKVLCYNTP